MAKLSVCIEMLLTEYDLYERPARAAALGFEAIEFWGTGGKDLGRLADACRSAGVAVAGFVGPKAFNLVSAHPVAEVEAELAESAQAAAELGTSTLIATVGNTVEGVSAEEHVGHIAENLKVMAPAAEKAGLKLALEMLNTLVDHKGYFLDRTAVGAEIVRRVGSPAVGLLYDVYHMQIMEGNLIETIRAHADMIHHVHVADVPGRMEPGSGEINYANVLPVLDEVGYDGYCGLEFRPSDTSEQALMRARASCGML